MLGAELLSIGGVAADINIQGLKNFPTPDIEFSRCSDITHEEPAQLLLGGTAANTAMVYAALVGKCGLGGVIGKDPFGNFLADGLAAKGVETIGPRGGRTATHTIALGTDGRRQAYWYPGSPLDTKALIDAWTPGHVFMSGINLCFERPLTDAAQAFGQIAHASGACAILDIGQGGAGALNLEEIVEIGREMDLLIGSEAEFAAALRCPYAEGRGSLREQYSGPVVVKQGAAGVVVDMGSEEALRRVPGFDVRVTNLIGAGDAFAGGLLSAWLHGADLESACVRGNAAGAVSVALVGGPQDVSRDAVDSLEFEGFIGHTNTRS